MIMKKNLFFVGLFLLFSSCLSMAQRLRSEISLIAPSEHLIQQDQSVLAHAARRGKLTQEDLRLLQKAYLKAASDVAQMNSDVAKSGSRSLESQSGMSPRSVIVDEKAEVITKEVEKDANGEESALYSYKYDGKARLVGRSMHQRVDGVLVLAEEARYEYDDNDVVTLMEVYSRDAKTGEMFLSQTLEQKFTSEGLLLLFSEKRGKVSADGAFAIGSQTENEYDDKGNLLSSSNYVLDNDIYFVPSVKIEYTYDDYLGQLSESKYIWNNWRWEGVYANGSIKGENGFVVGNYQLTDWDASANSWASGKKNIAYWNQQGQMSVDKQYDWVPKVNDWVCTLDNDADFDNQGRCTRRYHYRYDIVGDQAALRENSDKTDISYEDDVTCEKKYLWQAAAWTYQGATRSWYDYQNNKDVKENQDAAGNLVSTWERYYEQIAIGPSTVYPDILLVGTMTGWMDDYSYQMKDNQDGTVQLENVTIKKNDEFKLKGAADWAYNWGGNPISLPKSGHGAYQLSEGGGNLSIVMEADKVVCTLMKFDLSNKQLYIEFDASTTAVNMVAADGTTIVVRGDKIVTSNAKNVQVSDMGGQVISTAATTTVRPGLYVVKADGKVVKVQVK